MIGIDEKHADGQRPFVGDKLAADIHQAHVLVQSGLNHGPHEVPAVFRSEFAAEQAAEWLVRFHRIDGQPRPGIDADPSKPGLIRTPYGLLDPNPTAGEQILGRNSGRGPFLLQTNLRVSKTWGFGRETTPAAHGSSPFSNPAARRYNLTVGLSARNLLNHNNPGPIVGNITSPLFGQANQIAGGPNSEGFLENANNRRLELQLRFAF